MESFLQKHKRTYREPLLRFMEKTAPRHDRDADVLDKIMSEIPISKQAQSRRNPP